ncbi:MAG: hypothetical protein FWD96_01830 [Defluviitaleaceae bacterium]|nr:hypothetical protein [Defluviitaleaceae bacterium]
MASPQIIMRQDYEMILRTILYQVKTAETLADAEYAIEVMCSKETIAIVNSAIHARKADQRRRSGGMTIE